MSAWPKPTDDDWFAAYPVAQPRPGAAHVRMNFVSSADGAVTLDGRSGGLGGPNDRELMRILRSQSDVVLVGAGTVRTEGYGGLNLPEKHVERRRALGISSAPGASDAPRIALVSGSLDLSPDMSVFQKSEVRPLVFTHAAAPAEAREQLAEVADVVVCGNRTVDLGAVLASLTTLGLRRVLCEGGPGLFSSLLEADLVDEVCLTVSPMFVAGEDARIAHSIHAHPRKFRVASLLQDNESFVFIRYERTH